MFESIGLPKQSAKSRKANEKIWECIEQMPQRGEELVWSDEFGSWLSHVSADGARRFSYLGCIGKMSDVSAWCREHGLKFSVGRIFPISGTKKLGGLLPQKDGQNPAPASNSDRKYQTEFYAPEGV
jgi:hypothetical protein